MIEKKGKIRLFAGEVEEVFPGFEWGDNPPDPEDLCVLYFEGEVVPPPLRGYISAEIEHLPSGSLYPVHISPEEIQKLLWLVQHDPDA